jgi:hypothetical protein
LFAVSELNRIAEFVLTPSPRILATISRSVYVPGMLVKLTVVPALASVVVAIDS